MSLADAYADAHLDLDPLDEDIKKATQKLRKAVQEWERIVKDLSFEVNVDTATADREIRAAVQRWKEEIDDIAVEISLAPNQVDEQLRSESARWDNLVDITATVEADTAAATAEIAAFAETAKTLVRDITVNIDVEGIDRLAAAATVFEGIDSLVRIPVRFHIDQASVASTTAMIETIIAVWSRNATVSVDFDVDEDWTPPAADPTATPGAPRGPTQFRPGQFWTAEERRAQTAVNRIQELYAAFDKYMSSDNDMTFGFDTNEVETALSNIGATIRENRDSLGLTLETQPDKAIGDLEQFIRKTRSDLFAVGDLDLRVNQGKLQNEIAAMHRMLRDVEITIRPEYDMSREAMAARKLAAAIAEILQPKIEPSFDEQTLRDNVARQNSLFGTIRSKIVPEADTTAASANIKELNQVLEDWVTLSDKVGDGSPNMQRRAEDIQPFVKSVRELAVELDRAAGSGADFTYSIDEVINRLWLIDNDTTASFEEQTARRNRALRDLADNTARLITVAQGDAPDAKVNTEAFHRDTQRVFGIEYEALLDNSKLAVQARAAAELIEAVLRPEIEPHLNAKQVIGEAQRLDTLLEQIRNFEIKPRLDASQVVVASRALNDFLESILNVTAKVDINDPTALPDAEALAEMMEKALVLAAKIDLDSGGATTAVYNLKTAFKALEDIKLDVTLTGDEQVAAQLVALNSLGEALFDVFEASVKLDSSEAIADAAKTKAIISRILGNFDVTADLDVDTGAATVQLNVWKRWAARVANVKAQVDLDAAAVTGRLAVLRRVWTRMAHIDGRVDMNTSGGGMAALRRLFGGGGNGGFFSALSASASQAGASLTGVLGGAMSQVSAAGTSLSGVTSGLSNSLGGMGGALASGAAGLAQMAAMLMMIGALISTVAALIAALVAGIVTLIGTAAGWLTLAAGIGAVATAAGVLGIVLNEDLKTEVVTAFTTLKDSVADYTRAAGEYLVDNFLHPFVGVLDEIARYSARLTEPFLGPIAAAALNWLTQFSSLLKTAGAVELASGVGQGIAQLINTFADALPVFLDIANTFTGPLFTALDDIIAMFLELGETGASMSVSFIEMFSGLAAWITDIGTKVNPVLEGIFDGINRFSRSEFAGTLSDGIAKLVGGIANAVGMFFGYMEMFENSVGGVSNIIDQMVVTFGLLAGALAAVIVIVGTVIRVFGALGKAAGWIVTHVGRSIAWVLEQLAGFTSMLSRIPGASSVLGGLSDSLQSGADRVRGMSVLLEDTNYGLDMLTGSIGGAVFGMGNMALATDGASGSITRLTNDQIKAKKGTDELAEAQKRAAATMGIMSTEAISVAKQYKHTLDAIEALRAKSLQGFTLTPEYKDRLDVGSLIEVSEDENGRATIEKTLQDAVDEMMAEASDRLTAYNLARDFRAAGQNSIAAMIEGLTGEQLDHAIATVGKAGSAAATAWENELDRIEAMNQAAGGGLAGAVDKLVDEQRRAIDKIKGLKVLESLGLNRLAESFSALEGEDIDRAIEEMQRGGTDYIRELENKLKSMEEEAIQAGIEHNPVAAVYDEWAKTQYAAGGGEVSLANLDSIGIDKRTAQYFADPKALPKTQRVLARSGDTETDNLVPYVNEAIRLRKSFEQGSTDPQAKLWYDLMSGNKAPVDAAQRQIASLANLSLGKLTIGADGIDLTSETVSATQASATQLVGDINTELAAAANTGSVNLADTGRTIVTNLATGMANGRADVLAALAALAPTINTAVAVLFGMTVTNFHQAGGFMAATLARGITMGSSDVTAAVLAVTTLAATAIAATATGRTVSLIGVGQRFVTAFAVGITTAGAAVATATTTLAASAATRLVEAVNAQQFSTMNAGYKLIANMATGITMGATIVNGAITGLIATIGTLLTTAGTQVSARGVVIGTMIGRALSAGIAAGITSGIANVMASVQLLTDRIRQRVTSNMGIKSPSRVMMGYGTNITEGLALGITSQAALVGAAIDDLTSGISAAVTNIDPTALTTGQNIVDTQTVQREQAQTAVTDPVQTGVVPRSQSLTIGQLHLHIDGVTNAEDVPAAAVSLTTNEAWRLAFGDTERGS